MISEGVVPFRMIDDARAFHSTIATNKIVDLNEMNSGIVASTLNLLSQGKVIKLKPTMPRY